MKKLACAVLLSFATVVVAQQEPVQDATKLREALPQDQRVEALANDLHAISRITAVAGEDNPRVVVLRMLDQNIEALRGPRGDGTYEWATLQREEASRKTADRAVELVNTQETINTVTVTADNAYRVEVLVPRKRNAILSNNRVFVRQLIVELTAQDGKTTRQEIPVNAWVAPGDTHGEALTTIAKSAKVTAEIGVESGDKKALATLAVLQAKLVDVPSSPYFPAVRRLVATRELAADPKAKFGQLHSLADEALLLLPGELTKRTAEQEAAQQARMTLAASGTKKGSIAHGDATPDVTYELESIAQMMTGTLQEQTDARARLDSLIKALAPPVDTNAPASTPPMKVD